MDTNIRAIPKREKLAKKIRVAAYARVSSGKESMLHSLSYQVSYYNSYIQKHKDWLFAGVYADEAISGTKDERPEFQKLLTECRKGNVDLIVTKSVSRFARNTVTVLQTIRELTLLKVDVFFEEQNLHTLGAEGELIITALASYAEAEAKSVSENMKWRIQKNFKEGLIYSMTVLGYRIVDSHLEVVPEEAKAVKAEQHQQLPVNWKIFLSNFPFVVNGSSFNAAIGANNSNIIDPRLTYIPVKKSFELSSPLFFLLK